jgi:hypothetical protein
MTITGDRFDALVSDLRAAVAELESAFEREPARWERARPGKWSGGRHAEHLAISIENFAAPLEHATRLQREGRLPAPPRRDLLQKLFVATVVEHGHMPRGARTPSDFVPGEHPERSAVMARLHAGVERLAALGAGRSAAERDAVWIANPFRPQWRYTLTESLRVHAVHVRHHLAQIEEIPLA